MKNIFAEDVNYWQTSRTGLDAWLEKAKREIKRAGGEMAGSAMVEDEFTGRAGFMLAFQIGTDRFKLVWPVLKPRRGSIRAAKIQAARRFITKLKRRASKRNSWGRVPLF